jgi:hypothetical protein
MVKSLPATPKHLPKLTAINLPDISAWENHIIDRSVPVNEIATLFLTTLKSEMYFEDTTLFNF